jgi:hypothetical protein
MSIARETNRIALFFNWLHLLFQSHTVDSPKYSKNTSSEADMVAFMTFMPT